MTQEDSIGQEGTSEDDNPPPYAETSVFTRVLGASARVKIIDVFLGKDYQELSANEVAKLAGIDKTTFYRHRDDLLDIGLISKVGTVGNTPQYELNSKNQIAEILRDARHDLASESKNVGRRVGRENIPPNLKIPKKEFRDMANQGIQFSPAKIPREHTKQKPPNLG